MAKKKNSRPKHQKDACEDDTSDEELKSYNNAKTCPHVTKAVNFARVKKALKSCQSLEKCKDCEALPSEKVPNGGDSESGSNEVWLCLQCGYCGCGRTTANRHAMMHYKTPHSDNHAVVLSTLSMSIWCYICDDNVLLETCKSLRDCVDFIVKFKGKTTPNHVMVNGTSKSAVNVSREPHTLQSDKLKVQNKDPAVQKPRQSEQLSKNVNTVKKNASNIRCIKGLRNLGNTCFFNAVLQNLCQTPWLREELEQRSAKGYQWEISFPVIEHENLQDGEHPLRVPLLECYSLTQEFLNFLKQMAKASPSSKAEALNPSQLFDQICKKSPQFRGFHQQDSHELLRHLLDGIRNEEIKRQKRAILKAFNLSEKVNPDEVDEETRQLLKAYGSIVSHTIVDRIFGGQLLSTVVCEECKVSSQVFEPFMDLSLPLAEEKVVRGNKMQRHSDDGGDDDSGLYTLSKKKENQNTISKHQEKKMKQQAKKAAKKRVKNAKLIRSTSDEHEESEGVAEKNEDSLESITADCTQMQEGHDCNDEHSDADIEDNDESENVSSIIPVVEHENLESETVPHVVKDVNGISHTCVLDENIEELCNQITDIRIRRDSEKQDDLLEPVDDLEKQTVTKRQKSAHSTVLGDISDETDNSSWSRSQSEQQVKEWMMRSLTTLKARYQPSSLECSVNSCLNQFTASELLTGSNKFRCENCTNRKREVTGDKSAVVYSNASKQMLIFSPPAVLTLHLKRFQQTGMSLRKLNLFVEFPLILDLAPYCSSICLELPHMAGVKDEVLYSLYAVVQHSGRLTSGHYTAYVKFQENSFNPAFLNTCPVHHCSLEQLLKKISKVKAANSAPCNVSDSMGHKWYYISDSYYKEVSESEVLRCQAYILFYQRVK